MFTTEANTSILSDHYPLVSATFLNLAVVMIYWHSDCSITLVKYSFETICPDNVNLKVPYMVERHNKKQFTRQKLQVIFSL